MPGIGCAADWLRDHRARETELGRFLQALLAAWRRADFAGQANLTKHTSLSGSGLFLR
jgi:hypothetical protein